MNKYIKHLLIITLSSIFISGFSQVDIQREVRVVKPYTPTLSDAEKINLLPVFNDTLKVFSEIDYRIYPKPYDTKFRVKPIQPAKMIGVPLERLYKSQFSLGIGNYLSPFAELTVNQLRSRRSSMGLYLVHHSSGGEVKLENNEKVDAHYSDNRADLFGKIMYSKAVLEGRVSAGYNSVMYYGYNPELDTVLNKSDIKQKIYSASAQVNYFTAYPDSFHLSYNAGLKYNYTQDVFKNFEHGLSIKGGASKFLGDWYSGIDGSFDLFKKSVSIDSSQNVLISVNPYISKANSDWKFLVGLNTTTDLSNGGGNIYIYPKAKFEFNIIEKVLIPYMGVDGYREVNNYRKILFENPFIKPDYNMQNTDYALIGYLGLKGRYSSKIAFDLQISYSTVNHMYFFVNDTSQELQNQFVTETDNMSLLKASGEITWNHNEALRLTLKSNYYKYELDILEHPWHKPTFDASLNASYNLRNKILLNTALFYVGKRYAYGKYTDGGVRELQGYFDANLGLEYRYTKMLSFFLKLNNFGAAKYNIWNQYPAQRFQIMGGFTYIL
jgi:hypothetical protein